MLKGVIFDLDGVITGTAKIHSLAWESMFNTFLEKHAKESGEPFVPFDPASDYLKYVDGKPRMEGVRSFLESRNIELPFGELDDAPDADTICGLGNLKNKDFTEILRKEGPEVFQSSVDFIKELRRRGIRTGIASSSRNCQLILQLADLEDLFETRVDGEVSIELGLKGKPNPDIFTTAAANLGLHPHDCVVVEDAISGVQAGSAGNFGLVLGIAREIEPSALLGEGADIVVGDLGEISVDEVEEWFRKGMAEDSWNFGYHRYEPEMERLRETLMAVGNGYLGSRGAWEGSRASEHHYPGTYIAGIFNKIPSEVHGETIYNNDFVNCPNWLQITFSIDGGEPVDPFALKMLDYHQNLDMAGAVMERSMLVEDKQGRQTRISSRRFASMQNPHVCAMEFSITPENYDGEIEIVSGIDGTVENKNVARYSALASDHLEHVGTGSGPEGFWLHVRTNASDYDIITTARNRLFTDEGEIAANEGMEDTERYTAQRFRVSLKAGDQCRLEKTVAYHTSLDREHDNPVEAGRKAIASSGRFAELEEAHHRAWQEIWQKSDLEIDGDRFSQKALRFHTYHLVSTASPHNPGIDAGMPARGLNGEAYRGHIFWDEIFILPFFYQHFPDVAKALLMYRYNRLDAARNYARENGYKGAMFPWQTADDGTEETQIVHYNPQSDSWGPDLSRNQRHVSIAVFYNTWRYVNETGDKEFLEKYGAEMMFEIARFWASIAHKSESDGQYHIEGVMGPDEFHEELPGTGKAGVRDNSYTNIMAAWLLNKSVEMAGELDLEVMDRLIGSIHMGYDEVEEWRKISSSMHIRLDQNGILEQFEGYMGLDELDWDAYREKYPNIHRMDRILKAEGDSPDHYKVAKQADVLMTFYALSPVQVAEVLKKNGLDVPDPIALVRENYHYYEPRTSHGSTLSKVVHAIISSYLEGGKETAWNWFLESLRSDIHDTQGGTTQEGIHCGVMAGTLDVVTRYFAGLSYQDGKLSVQPNLPDHWRSLKVSTSFRGEVYDVHIDHEQATVTLAEGPDNERKVIICDKELNAVKGNSVSGRC